MTALRDHPASGSLRWNIKQSFRDYVGELPDGKESWTSALGGISDGDLVFSATATAVDEGSADTVLKFGGAVRFEGYRGMLRVDLSDPWVEITAEAATLTANVSPQGVAERRIAVATVAGRPESAGERSWEWQPELTSLTAAGAAILGSVYQPGTDAAGFTLSVTTS